MSRFTRWKRRTLVVATLAVAIGSVFGVGRAAATVIEQHHYSGTESFTGAGESIVACGVQVSGHEEAR